MLVVHSFNTELDNEYDQFKEPLNPGIVTTWTSKLCSDKLGSSKDEIEARLPMFLKYLENRAQQQNQYEQKRATKRPSTQIGDIVAIKIPRIDRSNCCPRNMAGVVISPEKNNVVIQTAKGIINQPISGNILSHWPSPSAPQELSNAPYKEISLITALRQSTSYTKQQTATGATISI